MFARSVHIILALLLTLTVQAASLLSDSSAVYLLTCSPGEALYERYGHTALLVQDPVNGIDEVYNYGIFDFTTEHFYWRFVRGETYYQLGRQYTASFLRSYSYGNRRVNVQQLNLTLAQRETLYRALLTNYLPENRVYLYNFVFDNCATRPFLLLMRAIGGSDTTAVASSYTGATGMTYRNFIRHYTPQGSWGDLGINLVFGPRADKPMTDAERLFLPEEVMWYIHEARFADGTPLVSAESIRPFEVERVPWYKTWYFGLSLLFVALVALSYYDRRRGRRTRWVDYILYGFYALLLGLEVFLTFFSVHPLVGFGSYLLIIPSLHLCARIVYLWR